jgi:hypothetical protein
MDINEVFKKYPEDEPSYNGTNYLTIVDIEGCICYAIIYFNDECEFEVKNGKVLAFTETDSSKIMKHLI